MHKRIRAFQYPSPHQAQGRIQGSKVTWSYVPPVGHHHIVVPLETHQSVRVWTTHGFAGNDLQMVELALYIQYTRNIYTQYQPIPASKKDRKEVHHTILAGYRFFFIYHFFGVAIFFISCNDV